MFFSLPMFCLFLLACFSVGFLGSLLGIGGGTFLIPILVIFFKFSFAQAMPVSLICGLITGLSGLYFGRHETGQHKAIKKAYIYEPAAIIAVFIATPWSYYLDSKLLSSMFAFFLLLISVISYLKNLRTPYQNASSHFPRKDKSYLGIFASLLSGASSGLFGISGGVLIVPLLSAFVGLALSEAITISLFIMVSTSIIALTIHSLLGNVLWHIGLMGILGVLPGSFLGSKIKKTLALDLINRIFLFFAVTMSFILFFEAYLGIKK